MDLIRKVYPLSSRQHCFIIVATDYFTKWVEAIPMRSVTQAMVIKFIEEQIIHRFCLPELITTDQRSVFVGNETLAFANSRGIKILNSTPYYAQANGQAEETNKTVINIVEKMVKEKPRNWDTLLFKALWAYRTSKRSSIGVTPFMLTYGHDVILPMKIIVWSARRALQNYLEFVNYNKAMIARL